MDPELSDSKNAATIVCLNEEFVVKEDASISPFDRGFLFGDGVFETLAATQGEVHFLEEHIDRLLEGCLRMSINVPWSHDKLASLIRKTYEKNGGGDLRMRISITRGVQDPPTFDPQHASQPTLFIYTSDLVIPSEFETKGMRVASVNHLRVLPEVKNMNFLAPVLGKLQAAERNVDSGVFVDDAGNALEGTHWNLIGVIDDHVVTPAENILLGITRGKVIEIARDLGMQVEERNVSLQELQYAEEVFATGTLIRVVPIVEIDEERVGNGELGSVTKRIQKEFAKRHY